MYLENFLIQFVFITNVYTRQEMHANKSTFSYVFSFLLSCPVFTLKRKNQLRGVGG